MPIYLSMQSKIKWQNYKIKGKKKLFCFRNASPVLEQNVTACHNFGTNILGPNKSQETKRKIQFFNIIYLQQNDIVR